jgi:hypothetical protein
MKKKMLFAITIIMMLFISCKKDHTSSQIIATFSPEALTYVKLPLNSYYIYKDSATGILDSVVVTTSNSKLVDVPKYVGGNCLFGPCTFPAYTYQEFNLRLTKFTSSSQQDWFNCTASTMSFGRYQSTDSDPLYLCGAFKYPFHSNTYDSVQIVSSIVIEGRLYSNVAIFAHINGQDPTSANYFKTVYYWTKGVGIIKREIQNGGSVKTDFLVRNG